MALIEYLKKVRDLEKDAVNAELKLEKVYE